jgi:hypothetical protein
MGIRATLPQLWPVNSSLVKLMLTNSTREISGMMIELSSGQLDALTVAEKVQLLEQVWQSLCCQPDAFPSPDWHADVLVDRSQRLLDGSSARIPWSEAEAQLQHLAE